MHASPADAPLIVTAHLDNTSFAMLDDLRRRYFPAGRNVVPAHVSLFHKLPGEELESVLSTLEEVCLRQVSFDLERPAPVFLGRGVAVGYQAEALSRLRAELARRWTTWLSPQDRQGFRAHVTIQNKVEAATARALFNSLVGAEFPVCRVEGLHLWRYRGGPWEAVAMTPFRGLRGAGQGV